MAESISFRCKGFRWPFWLSVFVLVNFTMTIMFLTFSIGLPPFISVAVMMLSMVFGIGILAGHMEYRLTQEGITQEIRPLKWSWIKLPAATRQFRWEEIKSYESGEDLSRGLRRYHFLYISLSRFPYQLRLSDDQASKEDLAAFEMAFQSLIENGVMVSANQAREIPKMATPSEEGQRVSSGVSQSTNIDDVAGRVIPVRRRPDFYSSRRAHLLFWLFVLLFAVIGYQMVITRNSNPTNYWRMAMVVVPGMIYFAWRLYGRQRPR